MAVLDALLVLPYCRIVAMRYCSIDAMTATQLLTNTTRFFPTGHWNPETLEPRDIGTPSNKVHREGKRHTPEKRQRAPTQGTALSLSGILLGVVGGFSAAWFMAKPLMEVTTSWLGACWFQVRISFSEMFLKSGGRGTCWGLLLTELRFRNLLGFGLP